ncbi:MAG: hypothetical protein OXG08_04455 [Gammaproteobacteria bacterium]|nr:hypothetical protein [Gammaproteobacteria bacterium]
MSTDSSSPNIGTFNESSLHLSLKHRYSNDPSQFERPVDGYIVDVQRDDRIVEIQTRGFGSLRTKLPRLLQHNSVTLVHPIAHRKTIVKRGEDGSLTRRLSPKRGSLYDIFDELVYMPTLLDLRGLELDVLLTHEEEIREFVGRRARRRRGWVVRERRLIEVEYTHTLCSSNDLMKIVGPGLPKLFTTEDLAQTMNSSRKLAQKAAYCLRLANAIESVSKIGNAQVYRTCA